MQSPTTPNIFSERGINLKNLFQKPPRPVSSFVEKTIEQGSSFTSPSVNTFFTVEDKNLMQRSIEIICESTNLDVYSLMFVSKCFLDAILGFMKKYFETQYYPESLIPFSIFESPKCESFPPIFLNGSLRKALALSSYASNHGGMVSCNDYQISFEAQRQKWLKGFDNTLYSSSSSKSHIDTDRFYKILPRFDSRLITDAYQLMQLLDIYVMSEQFINDFQVAEFRNEFLKVCKLLISYQCPQIMDNILTVLISKIQSNITLLNHDIVPIILNFFVQFLQNSNITSKKCFGEKLMHLAADNFNHPEKRIQFNSLKILNKLLDQNNPSISKLVESLIPKNIENLESIDSQVQAHALLLFQSFVQGGNVIDQELFQQFLFWAKGHLHHFEWQVPVSILDIVTYSLNKGISLSHDLLPMFIYRAKINLKHQESIAQNCALKFFRALNDLQQEAFSDNLVEHLMFVFTKTIEHEDWKVRLNTLGLLSQLLDKHFINSLECDYQIIVSALNNLEHPHWKVQLYALTFIGQLGCLSNNLGKVSVDILNSIYSSLQIYGMKNVSVTKINLMSQVFQSLCSHKDGQIVEIAKKINKLLKNQRSKLKLSLITNK